MTIYPYLRAVLMTSVTTGLRLSLDSTSISSAFCSLRNARRLASGLTSQDAIIRLEATKLSDLRRPLRYQRARPTHKAVTPNFRARDSQPTSIGPATNLSVRRNLRGGFWGDVASLSSRRNSLRFHPSSLPILLLDI